MAITTNNYKCMYCGDTAGTIDHVPPQSRRETLKELGLDKQCEYVEVRCCMECNLLLSDKPFWTIKDRRNYIKVALKDKYKKLLDMPSWTSKEINELSHSLRNKIIYSLKLKRLIRARINYKGKGIKELENEKKVMIKCVMCYKHKVNIKEDVVCKFCWIKIKLISKK